MSGEGLRSQGKEFLEGGILGEGRAKTISVGLNVDFLFWCKKLFIYQCKDTHASWGCGRSGWRWWLGAVLSCSIPEGALAGKRLP